MTGGLEDWRTGGLEDWTTGRLDDWTTCSFAPGGPTVLVFKKKYLMIRYKMIKLNQSGRIMLF